MKKNKKSRSQRVAEGKRKTKGATKSKARKKENKRQADHNEMMKSHYLVKRHKMLMDIMEKAHKKQAEKLESIKTTAQDEKPNISSAPSI